MGRRKYFGKMARRGMIIGLLSMVAAVPGAGDEVLELRQEYNAVAASIDTLVRLYGGKQLEQLTARPQERNLVPAGFEVVLIFWADDEAEVFLNDYRISDTRLTPTEVVIPSLYFQENNRLRAHCWDTDRVESGFMAGLYLRDRQGGLRQILVTEEGKWWVEGALAEERFYTHTQPDIPEARVIWGNKLFGEVWLEARFDGGALRRAVRQKARPASQLDSREQAMDSHEVVSRLVRLQTRRQELQATLERSRYGSVPVPYKGYLRQQLAFTLGKAGPLAEEQSVATANQLYEWAESLPPAQKGLIYRERRALKGVEAISPEQEFSSGEEGESERSVDYQPPPERGGPVEEGVSVWVREGTMPKMLSSKDLQWGLVTAATGLFLYLCAVGRQWWRLFNGKVWKE